MAAAAPVAYASLIHVEGYVGAVSTGTAKREALLLCMESGSAASPPLVER